MDKSTNEDRSRIWWLTHKYICLNSIDKFRWIQVFSLLLNTCLCIVLITLIIENRKLKAILNSFSISEITPLEPGEKVLPFKVVSLTSGDTFEIKYSHETGKYLFFIFSTNCPACLKNLEMWNKISDNDLDNVNIIGISIDNVEITKSYVTNHNVGFYTVSIADTSYLQDYKISGVPSTILICNNGTVENVWVGILANEQFEDVKRSVNMRERIN